MRVEAILIGAVFAVSMFPTAVGAACVAAHTKYGATVTITGTIRKMETRAHFEGPPGFRFYLRECGKLKVNADDHPPQGCSIGKKLKVKGEYLFCDPDDDEDCDPDGEQWIDASFASCH
jgi:hypothetical protein